MTVDEAVRLTCEAFLFEGYMTPGSALIGTHASIANTVVQHLAPGSTVLDFGSKPGNKTAVLQKLGYKCTAPDHLQDNWHRKSGNREKILEFVQQCGIDFKRPNNNEWRFAKEFFDEVMLHDVLEHLHDSPRELLNDLIEFVKPDGPLAARLGVSRGREGPLLSAHRVRDLLHLHSVAQGRNACT